MTIVGVDPAYGKPTATSVWNGVRYEHFLLEEVYDFTTLSQRLDDILPEGPITLILEGQEVYKGSPVKPALLIELANRTGFLEAAFCSVRSTECHRYLPKVWKGQVPPRVMMARIEKTHGLLPGTKQQREDLAHSLGLVEFFKKKMKKKA